MQAVKRVSAGNLSIQVYIWGKTKMDISYDYYRTFYYVAKYKSFTGAAEALLNSQPNITRTMKKLEKELGCTLFVRQRHGIALTPEGEKLYAHISVAFEHISYGEQEIARDKSLQSGIVTIAASEIALHCILLPTLKKFRNTYPGIHIRILTHSTPQAMDMLKRGLADFAIVTEPFEFISGFSFRILRKDIHDDDILVLAGADRSGNHRIKLEYLQVTSGVGVRSVASLGLNISGEKFEAAASGNGPVDAAIKALKRIIDRHMTLKEFTIQAISKGSDDVGKVHMQVEYDNQMYYGFGANTDIIAASVEAYIDCINKFTK